MANVSEPTNPASTEPGRPDMDDVADPEPEERGIILDKSTVADSHEGGETKEVAASEQETETVQEPISYPLQIIYCGNCGLPPEYCEYFPDNEKCRKWLEVNLPSQMENLSIAGGGEDEAKKGRQKRGGKGLVKAKKPGKAGPKRICLSRAPRGKKKSVTVITGLASTGIDLKAAAKFLATKFACGASVTGDDEIVIQGDVKDDLFDVLPEKWPEIDEDTIDDLGDLKR